MSSQKIRAFQFAKQSYLALRPELEQVAEDPAAAEEWIQTFSMLLVSVGPSSVTRSPGSLTPDQELVYSSGANAGLPAGEDTEVTNFLGEARARLLGHASAAWLDHSSRFVAGHEERLRQTLGNGLPAIFPAYDGYVKLAECRKQMEAGQISHLDFLRYRLNVAIHDPADPFTCGRPSPVEPVSSTVASPLEPLVTFPTYHGYAKLVEYRKQMEAGQISRLDFERHRVDVHLNDPANRSVEPWASLVDPSPLPRSAGRSLEPFRAASPGLGLTPNSPATHLASLAASPSDATAAFSPDSQSARQSAEPQPTPLQADVKRGPLKLMDVRTLDDYVRCETCIRKKIKCAPFVGTLPPYPCYHCVIAKRECIRDPATCRRRNDSVAPSFSLSPGLEGHSATAFIDVGDVSGLSEASVVSVVTYWRCELARSLAAHSALTGHIKFVRYQYSLVVKLVLAPQAASDLPVAKRARADGSSSGYGPTETRASSKGKKKGIDVGAPIDVGDDAEADGAEVEDWEGFAGGFGEL
ncbi:hypothetical protein EDB85DRAFT_1898008 [Lactarius pseudohatsudake]|nr:hypothetical protein EDB85DRAFT_1898008 [Lactarius pseudohatsudake]